MSNENENEVTTPDRGVGLDPNLAATLVENQISDPKSSQGLFDLPCGFLDKDGVLHTEIKVREITGHEEDMLANPKIGANKKLNELISRCIERVGQITDKGKLSQVVLDMTVGDRLFAIFAIRRVTVGDMYTYEAKCSECSKVNRYTVDLGDLELKKMPDPYKRVYEVVLPKSKKTVKFAPMTGRGEEQLAAMTKKKDDTLSMAIAMRVLEVDGEKPTVKSMKDLSSADRMYLRSQFDRIEGGVETTIDLECPECQAEFKQDLDVGQAGFFFPTEARKS